MKITNIQINNFLGARAVDLAVIARVRTARELTR